jgi:lipopolysaccharide/colanic/teichoic acid biosynthesis glycosyltransferase
MLATLRVVLGSPLLAAIRPAIRPTSPGPAVFRQELLGLHPRSFTLYTFRTIPGMGCGASETNLGTVHRREMSLGGRRPAVREAELYAEVRRRRFEVVPGITRLRQVGSRSRLGIREALDLDVGYARRQSARLDLLILVRTVGCLLGREAA